MNLLEVLPTIIELVAPCELKSGIIHNLFTLAGSKYRSEPIVAVTNLFYKSANQYT